MLEQKFESDKKENLSRITLTGNKAAANLKSFKKEFSKLEGKVSKLDEAIKNSKKKSPQPGRNWTLFHRMLI